MKKKTLYLLREGDTDHYKIGTTSRTAKDRAKDLSTGNKETLVVVKEWDRSALGEWATDGYFKSVLRHYNTSKEWFKFYGDRHAIELIELAAYLKVKKSDLQYVQIQSHREFNIRITQASVHKGFDNTFYSLELEGIILDKPRDYGGMKVMNPKINLFGYTLRFASDYQDMPEILQRYDIDSEWYMEADGNFSIDTKRKTVRIHDGNHVIDTEPVRL